MINIHFCDLWNYVTLGSEKLQGGADMKRDYLKYIAALLLFGSNGIVASAIALSSVEIVFWRTLIGSLLLLLIFLVGKNRFTFYKRKKELLSLGISGIAMGASWMFLYEAYQQIGVSIASLCYYCGPVIVMLLSPFLFHEKLTKSRIFGFLMVLCGIVLVNGQFLGEKGNTWGIFCGMMSAVMYALMVIFNKKAEHITGLENSMLQLIFSFLTVACFAGIRQDVALPAPNDITPILILGIVNTGIGCYFYFSSIGRLPVQTVAVCGYLEPLSAVIFAVVFLRETMRVGQLFGAALILGGALYCEISHKK